ncbi:hypothetical protein VTN00DRAFT_4049 [Thermoascus crustaceus]|uniref:uncharacterized protein n=1 Tax=Thermoascus crustaceus TaxID=5088 RepID=UPI003744674A
MKLFALSTLAIASLLSATAAAAVPGLDKREPLPAKEYMYKLASEKTVDDSLDKRAKEYMYKLNSEKAEGEDIDISLDKRAKEYMYKLASEKTEELPNEQ